MVFPFRTNAVGSIRRRQIGSAHVLDRVGPCPDRSLDWRVIFPVDRLCVQQVGQCRMLKAWIDRLRLIARGIEISGVNDLYDPIRGRDTATRPIDIRGISRSIEVTLLGDRRRSRNDVLVRRETWSLIGLEHAV